MKWNRRVAAAALAAVLAVSVLSACGTPSGGTNPGGSHPGTGGGTGTGSGGSEVVTPGGTDETDDAYNNSEVWKNSRTYQVAKLFAEPQSGINLKCTGTYLDGPFNATYTRVGNKAYLMKEGADEFYLQVDADTVWNGFIPHKKYYITNYEGSAISVIDTFIMPVPERTMRSNMIKGSYTAQDGTTYSDAEIFRDSLNQMAYCYEGTRLVYVELKSLDRVVHTVKYDILDTKANEALLTMPEEYTPYSDN